MTPSGIITFTTDFGHRGPFSAIMKGVVLSRFPDARVIDLMHEIPAQWPPEAGFWVSESYRWFSKGSLHVSIVDPGVGTGRKILLAEVDGHGFMAPDNGLLARLLDAAKAPRLWHLDTDVSEKLGLAKPSSTFHGRDLFAPVAAELAAGRVTMDDVGSAVDSWIPDWIDEPVTGADSVSGVILTIDTFGNLISNITAASIAGLRDAVVHFAGLKLPLQNTYADAKPGDYLALVNSFDVIEIARAEGNAASSLGAERGAPIRVTAG